MFKNTNNNIEMTFEKKMSNKGNWFAEVSIRNINVEEICEVSVVATSLKFPKKPEVMAEIDILKSSDKISFLLVAPFEFVPPYKLIVKWKNKVGKSFSSEFENLYF